MYFCNWFNSILYKLGTIIDAPNKKTKSPCICNKNYTEVRTFPSIFDLQYAFSLEHILIIFLYQQDTCLNIIKINTKYVYF